jgi:hypothetical protein
MATPTPSAPESKAVLEGELLAPVLDNSQAGPETAPESPSPEIMAALAAAVGEGTGPETPAPAAPLEAPTTITQLATRGCPSDWNIVGLGDGISATNRHSNEVFEGSIAEFNELLRG